MCAHSLYTADLGELMTHNEVQASCYKFIMLSSFSKTSEPFQIFMKYGFRTKTLVISVFEIYHPIGIAALLESLN